MHKYLRNNFSLPVIYRWWTHVVGGQITKYKYTTARYPNDRLLVKKKYGHKTLYTLNSKTLLEFSDLSLAASAADWATWENWGGGGGGGGGGGV